MRWQAAIARLGLPPADVLSYADVLRLPNLMMAMPRGALLRIDSPDRDLGVEHALLQWGCDRALPPRADRVSRAQLSALPNLRGQLLAPAQWYAGFCALLRAIQETAHARSLSLVQHPDDVITLFDKSACHARLAQASLPVAPALEPMDDYAQLRAQMKQRELGRVFVKLRCGSTAAGMLALRVSGPRVLAETTLEREESSAGARYFNSRKVRRVHDENAVAQLVNWLLDQGAHVETWIAKATTAGRPFDLRIVTIAGEPSHVVVRATTTPFANLLLGGQRSDMALVRAQLGEAHWQEIMATCRRVAAQFPRCLHLGIDLLIASGYSSHVVLEANAFGDLLPELLDARGYDTYTAQALVLQEPAKARAMPCLI